MTDTRLKERFEESKERIMKELNKREVCGIFHATRELDRFKDTLNLFYFDFNKIDRNTYEKYDDMIDDLKDYIIDVAVNMDNDIFQLRLDIEYLERRKENSETEQ